MLSSAFPNINDVLYSVGPPVQHMSAAYRFTPVHIKDLSRMHFDFHEGWTQPYWINAPGVAWECYPCYMYYKCIRRCLDRFCPHNGAAAYNAHTKTHGHLKAVEWFRCQDLFTLSRFDVDGHCPECAAPLKNSSPEYLRYHWSFECLANPKSAGNSIEENKENIPPPSAPVITIAPGSLAIARKRIVYKAIMRSGSTAVGGRALMDITPA